MNASRRIFTRVIQASSRRLVVACVSALLAQSAIADMAELDDGALSDVSGMDGIEVNISNNVPITATQIRWTPDSGTANEATLRMEDLSIQAVNATGTVLGGTYSANYTLDVGSNQRAATGGNTALDLNLALSRIRIRSDALRHEGDVGLSYGTTVLDGSGVIGFTNINGLLNNGIAGNPARIYGRLDNANLFYRQLWHQHPHIVMANMNALWDAPAATIGLSPDFGLRTAAPYINIRLEWDMLYKFPVHYPDAEFTVTGNDRPIIRFGWLGTLKDVELKFFGGGVWSGTSGVAPNIIYDQTNKSQGLHFSSRWNYVNNAEAIVLGDLNREFRWLIGEAAGTRTSIEISDWAPMPGNTYAHSWPLIALDVINQNQGPGGLCWGGPALGPSTAGGACTNTATRQFVDLAPGNVQNFQTSAPRVDAKSIALIVRDGNLRTYSSKVRIVDNGAVVDTLDWGLIYTLSNVNANIYLYPGGNPSDVGGGSLARGLIADVMLMSQSFDATTPTQQGFNWNNGSHFMIADTDPAVGLGIGLLSTSFMILADDLRLWVKPNWNVADLYEGGFDMMSRQSRFHIKALFGGGTFPSGSRIVRGANVNLNIEGMWNFRFSPSAVGSPFGNNFMGYSLAYRLMNTNIANFSENTAGDATDDGSFFSLSEPSNVTADFRLANITGDVALVNGRLDLRPPGEDGVRPKLVIANDIQIGSTANARLLDGVLGSSLPGGAAAQPLTIGRVEFGNKALGQIVIPSGQFFYSVGLKPQN